MKKGLKKLIAGVTIATSLAVPAAVISTGAGAGQEAKALSDWENEFIDAYLQQLAADSLKDWYDKHPIAPPMVPDVVIPTPEPEMPRPEVPSIPPSIFNPNGCIK